MPPAARTGTSGPTASTTSGMSTIVLTSPQWPPASVPCATRTSTPMCDLTFRVRLGADERADEHTVVVRELHDVGRRRTERVHEHLGAVLQRHLDLAGRFLVDAESGGDHDGAGRDPRAAPARCGASTAARRSRDAPGGSLLEALERSPPGHRPCRRSSSGMTMSTPYGLPSTCSSIHVQLDLELVGA